MLAKRGAADQADGSRHIQQGTHSASTCLSVKRPTVKDTVAAMHVLYIHQYFQTREQAGGTRSYEFARHLVEAGHNVTVLSGAMQYYSGTTPERYRRKLLLREVVDGIDVVRVGIPFSYKRGFISRNLGFLYFMVASTMAGLWTRSIDVIFATSTPLTVGVPAYLLSRMKRVPFIFEVRDLWPESAVAVGVLRSRVLITVAEWAEAFFYRKAIVVIALTRGIWRALRDKGVPQEKLQLITHGADVDLFKPLSKDNAVRAELGLQGKFVAVYSGAHGLANGLEVVIETARLLRETTGVAFLMAGDGAAKENLVRLADDYGLRNVIFLDPRPRSQLPEVLAAADLCLMILRNVPSFQTACPNKLFDYLAAGRPVLVNFPGEVKEMLQDTDAGIFVQPDDPHGMAQAILQLKGDPARCTEMGQRARALALDFAREKQAQKLESVLREVVQA